MKLTWYVVLAGLSLVACNKEPGEGGKAEIRGRLLEQLVSASGNPIGDPYPVIGENVFIIYGDATDGAFPDDNVDTGPTGEFRFSWLRKGTYTVYAISDCNECESGQIAVSRVVEIGDRKESITTGDITIERN